jgi:hypothetical protein
MTAIGQLLPIARPTSGADYRRTQSFGSQISHRRSPLHLSSQLSRDLIATRGGNWRYTQERKRIGACVADTPNPFAGSAALTLVEALLTYLEDA